MGSPFSIQGVLDILVALVGALGTFVLKNMRDDHKALERKHDDLALSLPGVYARRDDMKASLDEVKTMLRRIEDRLGTTPGH